MKFAEFATTFTYYYDIIHTFYWLRHIWHWAFSQCLKLEMKNEPNMLIQPIFAIKKHYFMQVGTYLHSKMVYVNGFISLLSKYYLIVSNFLILMPYIFSLKVSICEYGNIFFLTSINSYQIEMQLSRLTNLKHSGTFIVTNR